MNDQENLAMVAIGRENTRLQEAVKSLTAEVDYLQHELDAKEKEHALSELQTTLSNKKELDRLTKLLENEEKKAETLSQTITRLQMELQHERGRNMCDVCAGTGKPLSGKPCMCGGSGRMTDAVYSLREELLQRERELEEASKSVEMMQMIRREEKKSITRKDLYILGVLLTPRGEWANELVVHKANQLMEEADKEKS